MQVQLERHVEERSKCDPWDRMVADAGLYDPIVQLGQATIFAAGVARKRRVRRSGANVHPLKRQRTFWYRTPVRVCPMAFAAKPRNICKPAVASRTTRGGSSSD